MNFLEERIVKDGIVKEGNVLKVDSFLNHQMDIKLLDEMGAEFKRRFAGRPINKILTIEASGIGIACIAAQHFDVPVVFAKKSQSINLDGEMYVAEVESFTHKCRNHVSRRDSSRAAGSSATSDISWNRLRSWTAWTRRRDILSSVPRMCKVHEYRRISLSIESSAALTAAS